MLPLDTSLAPSVSVLVTLALPLGLLVVLIGCLQCFRKKQGFSSFTNDTSSINADPGQVNHSFTLTVEDSNGDLNNSTAVTIEPLPDISKLKQPIAPQRPRIGYVEKNKQDASLKLIAVYRPFPRNQIVYLKELGSGWFGKVIESDAERIVTGVARNRVTVKMLKDDATTVEQQLFLEEVAPFRELEHTNIARLLGQCIETTPFLMIMESAAYGSLKEYLCTHRHSLPVLIQKNRLMQFALDACCGLACLHRHDYLHRDLAARNCLVMSDYTVKIGDYGIADDLFKEDYMMSGDSLLPIRWMAPETLKQDNGFWIPHNFSKQSDIWSLGVTLWEIAMLGEQPYSGLPDREVLQRVVLNQELRLSEPDIIIPHKDRLYEVMRFCWLEPTRRTKVDEVYSLLEKISTLPPEPPPAADIVNDFEHKWDQLRPNKHHLSSDSLDHQLASTSRADSNLVADHSLEDLTTSDLAQPDLGGSLGKGAALEVDYVREDGSCGDPSATVAISSVPRDEGVPPSLLKAGLLSPGDVGVTTTLKTLTDHTDVSVTGSSDFSLLDDSSLSFEILDTSTEPKVLSDADLAGDDVHDFQMVDSASATASQGLNSVMRDGESAHEHDRTTSETEMDVFTATSETEVDVITAKDYPTSLASDITLSSGLELSTSQNGLSSITVPMSESDSQIVDDTTSSGIKTTLTGSDPTSKDTDMLASFGTELSSLSSLVVTAPAEGTHEDREFPSFGTELSSLSSFNTYSPATLQAGTYSDPLTSDLNTEIQLERDGSELSTKTMERSLGLELSFDTLDSLSGSVCKTPAAQTEDLVVRDDIPEETVLQDENSLSSGSDAETAAPGDQLVDNDADLSRSSESSIHAYETHLDLSAIGESFMKEAVDSTDSTGDAGHAGTDSDTDDMNRLSTLDLSASLRGLVSEGGCQKVSTSPASSKSASPASTPTPDQGECGAEGGQDVSYGESEPTGTTTDSDSTSNSDSGKDYICEEAWGGEDTTPPPSSPATEDSEEYSLMIASEIYLSRGLKMGRPFESSFLEPIPEEPLHSISEESGVPAPSETSSADVRFEDVFEWDDFMGEPLVGKERSSSDISCPQDSFEVCDWSLDAEGESLRTASSILSHPPDSQEKVSSGSYSGYQGSTTTPLSLSSVSDSEQVSQGQSRTHRSFVSDFLSSRSKGLTLNTASSRPSTQSHFYSLYGDDLDLGSDSQSEGSCSPPVYVPATESQGPPAREGGLSWQSHLSSSLDDMEKDSDDDVTAQDYSEA